MNVSDTYFKVVPKESPVYGGIYAHVITDQGSCLDIYSTYFIYIEGSSQSHACSANVLDPNTLKTYIPEHDTSEAVKVIVIKHSNYIEGSSPPFAVIGLTHFTYLHDSAYHVAQFLLDNVQNPQTLECLDIENFEYISKTSEFDRRDFDTRLHLALNYIGLPHHWSLVATEDDAELIHRETLLHLLTRFGLIKVVAYFLDKPGADVAKNTPNSYGYTPRDIATIQGHQRLINLLRGELSISDVLKNESTTATRHSEYIHQSNEGHVTLTFIPAFHGYSMYESLETVARYCESNVQYPHDPIVLDEINYENSQSPHQFVNDEMKRSNKSPDKYIKTDENSTEKLIENYFNFDVNGKDLENATDEPCHLSNTHNDDDDFGYHNLMTSLSLDDKDNCDFLQESLQYLRDINADIQLVRDHDRSIFLNIQDKRHHDLKRFSSSCPSLDGVVRTTPLSPVLEESTRNIKPWDVSDVLVKDSMSSNLAKRLHHHSCNGYQQLTEPRSLVQIMINDQIMEKASGLQLLQQYVRNNDAQTHPEKSQSTPLLHDRNIIPIQLSDDLARRNSDHDLPDADNRLNVSGKSLSLNCLDKCDSSDNEDIVAAKIENALTSPVQPGISVTCDNQIVSLEDNDNIGTNLIPMDISPTQPGDTCNGHTEKSFLFVSAPIHKSSSSPSFPDSHEDDLLSTVLMKDKQHAQIQRQDGIEEDEDDALTRIIKADDERNKRMTYPFKLDEERPKISKEEKRRKGVLSLLSRGSYRAKKVKERESILTATHQFVSVSVSNSRLCRVCAKSLINKPALQCQACMINVHEHSCKDHVPACSKQKSNYSADSSSTYAEVPDTGLSVNNVQGLKDKRSSSTPARTQMITTATPTNLQRSSTSPTRRMVSEDKDFSDLMTTDILTNSTSDITTGSTESLDAGEILDFDEDPELKPFVPECEAWSVTVDKKVLKKMNAKDIKRQDTIWELIQTEFHHCRGMKILQKLYRNGMAKELQMQQDTLDRLFPGLDELIDFHMIFLNQLRELQNRTVDKYVCDIGPLLLSRFSGVNAEQMTGLYGKFCSCHKESVQIYKDLLKSDRKFQAFTKRCDMTSFAQKREIPGFILLISQRITKYPILIENILKSTKEKQERDNLDAVLRLSKDILTRVDAIVDAAIKERRLSDIYQKIEGRQTTSFHGKKFKKSDLKKNNRKLLHEGLISLKNARGKVIDILAVVLSDLILFLQESNQKYSFAIPDNKPATVPLYHLLVREDARDNRGIYLISQNRSEVEMYKVLCRTADDCRNWISVLRSAVDNCPVQEESVLDTDHDKQMHEDMAAKQIKIREIIEMLQMKDQEIKTHCDEKNRLFSSLFKESGRDISLLETVLPETADHDVHDVLMTVINEATQLAVLLQDPRVDSSSNLSRSISSVGERVRTSCASHAIPKRAETFAGFDHHEKDIILKVKKNRHLSLLATKSSSQGSVSRSLSSFTDERDNPAIDNQCNSSPGSQSQNNLSDQEESDIKLFDRGSVGGDRESLRDVSLSFSDQLSQGAQDQTSTFAQLVLYLHNIMHLAAQQCTAVEHLRSQLFEANEQVNKLQADLAEKQTPLFRHNQLEELRNLQENVSRERQQWERDREEEKTKLDREYSLLCEQRLTLEKERNDLKSEKDELQRQKEVFQKQIDLLRQNEVLNDLQSSSAQTSSDRGEKRHSFDPPTKVVTATASSSPAIVSSSVTSAKSSVSSTSAHVSPSPVSHKRSSSADLSVKNRDMSLSTKTTVHNRNTLKYQSLTSTSNKSLPLHLMSCTNEQKAAVGSSTASSKLTHRNSLSYSNVQQVLPYKLSASSLSNNNNAGNNNSSSKVQSQTTSSLSLVKKLAEPSSRNRVTSQPCLDIPNKFHESKSTSQLSDKSKEDNTVVYF